MTTIPESRLNDTINEIFDYIDWYKEYDAATTDSERRILLLKYPNEVATLLVDTRIKVEDYFDNVLDQPIYLTDDYLRLRDFLINWYSAFNAIMRKEQKISDIGFIDKSLLLDSLGYDLYNQHNSIHQTSLCTALSDMYAQKGSPLCLSQAMTFLDISNFTLFEYWLDRDPADNELIFNPYIVDDMTYYTGFTLETRPAKPYVAVTEKDPHWYLTEAEIEAAEAAGELGLPSMTPYIGVISANDWVKQTRLAMAYINRFVTQTYANYLTDPTTLANDQKYYFFMLNENVSLLELYLASGYVYNVGYNRNSTLYERDGVTEDVFHYNGPEEDLYSEVQFITEYNQVYKRTYDRFERDDLLDSQKTTWQTPVPVDTLTHSDSAALLNTINPDLKSLCDAMLASNQTEDFLIELLKMLDYYIKHDLGLTSFTFLFMLYDPLQENAAALTKVFQFFKPYQTRLIEAISYLVINDVPGDCLAISEKMFQELQQALVDYYLLFEDKMKDTIKQRIDEKLDVGSCHKMMCDWFGLSFLIESGPLKLVMNDKVNQSIHNAFIEYYLLYKDNISMNFETKTFDRYNFNFPRNLENPVYAPGSFEYSIFDLKEKHKENVKMEDDVSIMVFTQSPFYFRESQWVPNGSEFTYTIDSSNFPNPDYLIGNVLDLSNHKFVDVNMDIQGNGDLIITSSEKFYAEAIIPLEVPVNMSVFTLSVSSTDLNWVPNGSRYEFLIANNVFNFEFESICPFIKTNLDNIITKVDHDTGDVILISDAPKDCDVIIFGISMGNTSNNYDYIKMESFLWQPIDDTFKIEFSYGPSIWDPIIRIENSNGIEIYPDVRYDKLNGKITIYSNTKEPLWFKLIKCVIP